MWTHDREFLPIIQEARSFITLGLHYFQSRFLQSVLDSRSGGLPGAGDEERTLMHLVPRHQGIC
jgi:hypothetical protein